MITIRQTIRSFTALALTMSASVFAGDAGDAGDAGYGALIFTIEAPGIQVSQVPASDEVVLHTQDFDSIPTQDEVFRDAYPDINSFTWPKVVVEGDDDPNVGSYQGSGAQIDTPNKYGAAGGTGRYIFIKNTGSSNIDSNPGVTLTFTEPVAYFGFWWSAGDPNNKLQITLTDGSIVNVGTDLVLNSVGFINTLSSVDGHLGSPTDQYKDQNSSEGYAYLNLFAKTEEQKIQKIRFHGTNFETDNHTITTTLVDPTGTPIPLPLDFGQTGRFSFREMNTHIVTEASGGGVNENNCYENSNGNANENCQNGGNGNGNGNGNNDGSGG